MANDPTGILNGDAGAPGWRTRVAQPTAMTQ